MKVGIDARLLSQPVTGIGRYTAELTRELIKLDGRFNLYTPAHPIVGDWQNYNTTIKSANYHSRIGRMLWSQIQLPYWASKDQVEVFWGTTHRLPRYLPSSIARVVTIHDMVWKYAGETMRPFSRWMDKRLMPEAINLADRIIADSYNTAREIKLLYPQVTERVHVVQLGLADLPSPLDFQSLAAHGIEHPYFLFVGTLEPRKNLERLLKSYAKINETLKNSVSLVIAGGKGWGGIDLEALIRDLGLTKHVTLVGYVDDKTLSTLYAHARFLAMPSIYEGFGLPILEAMSFSVPALTSNNSAMPEVAGDAGLLVDPYDLNSISQGLTKLIGDNKLRDHLASKAKNNADRFTWQKAAHETWQIMEKAFADRRSRRETTPG